MPTSGYKLVPFVEGAFMWMAYDEEFFVQAQVTSFSSAAVGPASL